MPYRKLAADQLFTGYEMLADDSVLITDEKGTILEIVENANAGDDVERYPGILSPGFINCHCHLELSHMKGIIPPQTGMVKFLLTVMQQRSSNASNETMLEADMQMFQNGIVAVGDICNTDHSAEVKNASKLYYHNFIEVAGFVNAAANSRFAQAVDIYSAFQSLNKNRQCSIVPHAPYSVSDKLFQLIDQFPGNHLLSIHNQESADEGEFFVGAKGAFTELYDFLNVDIAHFSGSEQGSLVHSLKKISSRHQLVLVHNVHTSEEDLQWINSSNRLPSLYWCLCPNANLYINQQLPDVYLLKKYDCKMVVGTDSLASNFELNILGELKILQENFSDLTVLELLKWATVNGAEALNIERNYGSFEKGKVPGIINIEGVNGEDLLNATVKRVL